MIIKVQYLVNIISKVHTDTDNIEINYHKI